MNYGKHTTLLIYDVQQGKKNKLLKHCSFCPATLACLYKYLLEWCCCDMLICNIFLFFKNLCAEVLSLVSRPERMDLALKEN